MGGFAPHKTLVGSGTLNIVTFNTYCAPTKPDREARASAVVNKVVPTWHHPRNKKFKPADVVALQEIFGPAEIIPGQSKFDEQFTASDKPRVYPVHSGLAMLSRHPLLEHRFFPFNERASVTRFAYTGVQRAVMMHPDLGPVTMVNAHLQSSFDPMDPMAHSETRMLQLGGEVAVALNPSKRFRGLSRGLTVFAGDLNYHPIDFNKGHPTPEGEFIKHRLGLVDPVPFLAKHHRISEDNLMTFGPGIKLAEADYARGPKTRFDQILIGTLNPLLHGVVDLSQSHVTVEDTGLSDHMMVRMQLKIDLYRIGLGLAKHLGTRVSFVDDQIDEEDSLYELPSEAIRTWNEGDGLHVAPPAK